MTAKAKISFVIPTGLQQELAERTVKDGYGLRGKSKWVSEAIDNLLNINNYPELVNYSDEMRNLKAVETITVDKLLKLSLNNSVIVIRKQYPMLEGLQSRIVRTAILQRLLRS